MMTVAGIISIVAAGDFPIAAEPLKALSESKIVIACDSAACALLEHGIIPDYAVGDMDSMPPSTFSELNANGRTKFVKIDEQDDNDLTKAFRLALTLNPAHIHILGATGKREDHTLANVSLLADYALELERQETNASGSIDMLSDYGIFLPVLGSCTVQCKKGQEISIFSFDHTLRIHSEGLQYPTDAVVFDTLWKASLNKSEGESFELTFNHPAPAIVYKAF